MKPSVYVILLNYCGARDTVACLESLKKLDYPDFKIIVVDNASPDDSVAVLKKAQSAHEFLLFESHENGGYSAGNNVGIQFVMERHANDDAHKQPYLWLLNNDTTVEPNSLSMLVAEAQKTGGLVGSLLLYPDRTYQQVGTVINWTTGSTKGIPEKDLQDGMRVECLTGASMLIPMQVLRKIGMLDESFFLYFEDAEFCLRAAQRNFYCTLALRSRVFHKEGATTGKKSLNTQYYFHRNRMKVLSMYATASQKITISLYTRFRMLRSVVKCRLKPSPEREASNRVQRLAMEDYRKGIGGPCPHNLNQHPEARP